MSARYRWIVLACLVFLLAGSVQAATLQMHYDCEDDVLDQSAFARHGTNTGVTFNSSVIHSYAGLKSCFFDSGDNDDIELPTNFSIFNGSVDFVFSGYARFREITGTVEDHLFMFDGSSDLRARICSGAGTCSGDSFQGIQVISGLGVFPIPKARIPQGEWTYFEFSYNATTGGGIQVFFNSTLVLDNNLTGTLASPENNNYIGSDQAGANNLIGNLDELKIFSGLLSQTERTNNWQFNSPAGIPYSNINQSTYNVTSGYLNTTAWRTNTSLRAYTTDNTSTISFSLDVAGNCSISKNNVNYTANVAADAGTKCATTETALMSCTAPASQAAAVNETLYYLGCISTNGIENATSSSGPLKLYYNAPPLMPNGTSPLNLSTLTSGVATLRYSSTDPNSDAVRYYVYASKDLTNISLIYNGTANTTGFAVADGDTWYWRVHADDGISNSTNSSLYQFNVSIASGAGGGGGQSNKDKTAAVVDPDAPTCANSNARIGMVTGQLFSEFTIDVTVEWIKAFVDWILCNTQLSIVPTPIQNNV